MLKQRVITALVLFAVFSSIIFFASSALVGIAFSLVVAVISYELQNLTANAGKLMSVIFSALFAAIFWVSIDFIDVADHKNMALVGVIIWAMVIVFLITYRAPQNKGLGRRLMLFMVGLVMLWIAAHGIIFIRNSVDQGIWILLYLLSLVAVADIGAYFCGKRWGKNKLALQISPGKTIEGALGGLGLNMIWMFFIYWLSAGWGMSPGVFVLTAIVVSVVSVAGDLFESVLKRESGCKDSGKILPGHGGALDRFDGLIAATPVFVYGLLTAQSL